jgi:hypothetical protein
MKTKIEKIKSPGASFDNAEAADGFRKSGHVSPLITVEPRLAEYFSNGTIQILSEEFAARLLLAGRLNKLEQVESR